MLQCLVLKCILALSSRVKFDVFLEQVKHSTANFDSAAKIHCFNEQWSTGSDSFYIDVEFKSTNPSSDYETVAKYLVS